jgi:lactate dehydrogenase-like 2-hydroxyacid dehydrogenase
MSKTVDKEKNGKPYCMVFILEFVSYCMKVGILGIGIMGSQIALRLAHKGHKVTVFKR